MGRLCISKLVDRLPRLYINKSDLRNAMEVNSQSTSAPPFRCSVPKPKCKHLSSSRSRRVQVRPPNNIGAAAAFESSARANLLSCAPSKAHLATSRSGIGQLCMGTMAMRRTRLPHFTYQQFTRSTWWTTLRLTYVSRGKQSTQRSTVYHCLPQSTW